MSQKDCSKQLRYCSARIKELEVMLEVAQQAQKYSHDNLMILERENQRLRKEIEDEKNS